MPPDAASARGAEQPLRILMILESDFTQKGGGGAESQLKTLARHLNRIGHRVTIVTPLLPRGPQVTAERCYGLPIARVPYPRMRLVGGIVLCARFAAFLVERRRHYDAFHVHIGHHLGAVACLVGSLTGVPVVVKISGWWELEHGVMSATRRPFDRLACAWLKRASTVQAISTRIASELEKHGFPRERILVLPNAVDTSRFARRTGLREEGRPFSAVFVGRLVPEKGLETLFDAWAAAFPGRTDVRLTLVGGGTLEPTLRERAEQLGIAGQVTFLGHQDRVEDILAGADIGLLTSRIEGLSNTLLEFMAAGLPTIASRVSGSEDFVVPGRNGWLFPVGDSARLASCLREAASMSVEQLAEFGSQARRDVESRAALEIVVGRLLSLYRGGDSSSPGAVRPALHPELAGTDRPPRSP